MAMAIVATCSAQTAVKFNVPKYGDVNALVYIVSEKAPTLVFFPGNGESGTDVNKLYTHGPMGYIKKGWKPAFNIIAIQPRGNGTQTHINYTHAFLQWACRFEGVDSTNIFGTGLSGGAAMWFEYIKKHPSPVRIRGLIPMSITTDANCELTTSVLTEKLCGTDLRYKDIPTWGFCGKGDSHYGKMNRYFDRLEAAGYDTRFTEYSGGHSGWSTYYNPEWKENGASIYDWVAGHGVASTAPVLSYGRANVLYSEGDIVKVGLDAVLVYQDGKAIEYRLQNGLVIKIGTRWVVHLE